MEPKFTCSFCWREHDSSHAPKLIGRQSRIACEPCWRALLDLSICWKCGELIVREDEVISLGWCFWHKLTCFCCLGCGTLLNYEHFLEDIEVMDCKFHGSPQDQHIADDESAFSAAGDGDYECNCVFKDRTKRPRAIEITVAPHCEHCIADGMAQLSSAVDNHTKSPRKAVTTERDSPSRPTIVVDVLQELLGDVNKTVTVLDGPVDSFPSTAPQSPIAEETPLLYVSTDDPLGAPAFRPSPTKPIPKWMSFLSKTPQESDNKDTSPTVLKRKHSRSRKKSSPCATPVPIVHTSPSRGSSTVDDLRPLRPSLQLSRSHATASSPPRPRTPYPFHRAATAASQSDSYFVSGLTLPVSPSSNRISSMGKPAPASDIEPGASSEYLDKYKPKTSRTIQPTAVRFGRTNTGPNKVGRTDGGVANDELRRELERLFTATGVRKP